MRRKGLVLPDCDLTRLFGRGWSFTRAFGAGGFPFREQIAAAVAGDAYEESPERLVDADAKRPVDHRRLRLNLPPLAVLAESPILGHCRLRHEPTA